MNDSDSSRDFRFTSFDTWRVLLNEVCLPSLEVVNGRLKLLAISLGEVFLGGIASTPFIVRHNLVLSVLWSMLSTNSLHCVRLCSDVALVISSFIADSRGEAGSCLRRSSRSSIMAKIFNGTCCVYILRLPVGICLEAAFNIVARYNFSSFWQSL